MEVVDVEWDFVVWWCVRKGGGGRGSGDCGLMGGRCVVVGRSRLCGVNHIGTAIKVEYGWCWH